MRDNYFGQFTTLVHMTLYNTVFLSSMLFNSQSWSCLSCKDLLALKTFQLRTLKKILGVRKSTSNAFVFLELGVLPIEQEIHLRQLGFLYHISKLNEDDLVKKLLEVMKIIPFPSWWRDVKNAADGYNICLKNISEISKDKYKLTVKLKIIEKSHSQLTTELSTKSKTKSITYKSFKRQDYLNKMNPKYAKLMAQARSGTLDIKTQNPKYDNKFCRWCFIEEENLPHIVNCGSERLMRLMLTSLKLSP